MSQMSVSPFDPSNRQDIPALEADLAYFEARLSLLNGLPDSLYQRAQLRTYGALEQALNDVLHGLRSDGKKRP